MAENQKLDNLLNLALSVSEEEREQSEQLMTGYEERTKRWELIVKFHGNLKQYETTDLQVEELLAGYAIVTLAESLIQEFADLEEVEYIEKPKRLYFATLRGKQASCISEVTIREPNLTGRGVLIGIIDSGIDYQSSVFRDQNGNTRIRYLWDQTLFQGEGTGNAPDGFQVGVEFSQDVIQTALDSVNPGEVVPSIDSSGHGTAVAAIAAGSINGSSGTVDARVQGVAPESELIVVKMGRGVPDSFPRTVELMRALTYVVQKAEELQMPVAVNLSFGNTYGSHDGTSLVERFMNQIAEYNRCVICVGSGNEGAASGHNNGIVTEMERQVVELNVGNYQPSFGVQLWQEYTNQVQLFLIPPSGERVEILLEGEGTRTLQIGSIELLVYIGEPSPYSVNQETYFEFLPQDDYVDQGIWTFELVGLGGVAAYDFYLPSEQALSIGTRFFEPTSEKTLTIPSTAERVITVGAYDVSTDAYADFSGRGYPLTGEERGNLGPWTTKPDLVAPGVNVITVAPGNLIVEVSGTSFATPFVTGSAALLMEWGIVRGNDPYLYGEKMKAYLRKGARRLRGENRYPNERVGWGALCVKDALP